MTSLLGQGSFGKVLGRGSIAKKCIELVDWEALNSIVREMHVLRMNLPNMVEYISSSYKAKENTVQIKMKRYDMDLRKFLLRDVRSRSSITKLHLITQLLDALYFLHGNGVIHRDIKPENVLVTMTSVRPIVVLCDFGLARQHCDEGETYTGYMVTRWYRPPETWVRDGKFNPSIDIWSMGCVFYEIIKEKPLYVVENFEDFNKQTINHDSRINELKIEKVLCMNMLKLKATERWNINQCMQHMGRERMQISSSYYFDNEVFNPTIQTLMNSNLTSEYTPRVKSYTKMLFNIGGSSPKDFWCCLCIACMLFQEGSWSASHKICDYVKMSEVFNFYCKFGTMKLPQCQYDYHTPSVKKRKIN